MFLTSFEYWCPTVPYEHFHHTKFKLHCTAKHPRYSKFNDFYCMRLRRIWNFKSISPSSIFITYPWSKRNYRESDTIENLTFCAHLIHCYSVIPLCLVYCHIFRIFRLVFIISWNKYHRIRWVKTLRRAEK